jgi:prefoldin subunit 5
MSDYKESVESISARILLLEQQVAELQQFYAHLMSDLPQMKTSIYVDKMNENFG